MMGNAQIKCPKCSAELKSELTRSSVMIDVCTGCKGVWFDRGEMNFFVQDRRALELYELQGLADSKEVLLSCPKCNDVNLHAGKIPGFRYEVEECPSCKGLFVDEHEFKKLGSGTQTSTIRKVAGPRRLNRPIAVMPALGLTSVVIMGSMYAFLFGFMVFLVEADIIQNNLGWQLMLGFVALQFLLAPVLMDWSVRLFGSLTWVDYSSLPEHLRNFITETCAKNKIPLPRVGIIDDGGPQAYTYGRTPSSARLVISRGLLELLQPEEVEAVVAHELGHITHWDFVVMTLAQLVPLILYHAYRICRDLSRRRSSGGKTKNSQHLVAAAVTAYIAYIVSLYLVMFISRAREYWADKFSVETTKNPNALIHALTKIAYGLVAASKTSGDEESRGSIERKRMAVESLGIMNISHCKEMALYASQGVEETSIELKEIMRWDLWSPWASYFELHSTHPLTAKRINAIGAHALNMGIEPAVIFDLEKPESYWDDFFKDVFVLFLPLLGAATALVIKLLFISVRTHRPGHWDWVMPLALGMSIGGFLKTMLSYPGAPFLDHSIRSLLKMVKVSPVTSYAVKLKGQIIGRGDPGRIFCEDMVIRDPTGIIFLDYQHGFSNWYFALFKMDQFMDHEVEIEGWYRRAPIPFIEVRNISTGATTSHSYTYLYKLLFWITLPILAMTFRHLFT